MGEPSNYKKAALDWLAKFGNGCVARKNIWQAKLHKLVQITSERFALMCEHVGESSERIRAQFGALAEKAALQKDSFAMSEKLAVLRERVGEGSERIRAQCAFLAERAALLKEIVTSKVSMLYTSSASAFGAAGQWAGRYKKHLISGVAVVLLVAVVFSVTYKPIFAVEVDGEVIAYVHDVEELQESFDGVVERLEEEFGQEVAPGQSIEFVRVRGEKVEVSEVDEVKQVLLDCVSMETNGYMVVIDDKETLAVSCLDDAEGILQTIKDNYISKHTIRSSVIEEIEIEEDVEFIEKEIAIKDFVEPEDAVAYLMTGGVETRAYEVARGDSLWSISKEYSISLEDLRKANPDIQGDTLSIGQKLNLEVISPYLNIITRERMTETVRVAFSEEVRRDSSMWTGERRVAQRGQSGQKEVVYAVVRRNGVILEKEKESEKVIQEPVAQVVVRGSRQDTGSLVVGTGRFLWPVQGRITSRYGSRSGGFHTGVDIAAPRNTPIRAADAGTVTVAVYSRSGYGNRVEINHGNGYSTLYAHCNSLAVRQGQTVKKGQVIAYVGSTGRSSGDHLHFEIRINGRHVNPMRYF